MDGTLNTKYGDYEYAAIGSVEHKGLLWKAVVLFWFWPRGGAPNADRRPRHARFMHQFCSAE